MKKVLLFLMAALVMASCTKQANDDQPVDKLNGWGGYMKQLKYANEPNQLLAGRYINVGTVTYEIDEVNALFKVTYNTTASGWTISEAHMYAGTKAAMPVANKKNPNPKIGHFPAHGYYSPRVSVATLSIPLSQLPDPETGFVVAAHAVVRSASNQEETAWAFCPSTDSEERSYPFTDKNWGWYDKFTFQPVDDPFTILYGTEYSNDSLKLYHINVTTGGASLIFKEYVGNHAGTFDGAAYDISTGMFFFVNYDSKVLYGNQMKDDYPSFEIGTLSGTAASGTYYNGSYYYVNEEVNTINKVTFGSNYTTISEVVLDTIPNDVVITDIAMSPTGDKMYMVGTVDGGGTEMITWNTTTGTFYTMAMTVNPGVQIAYGSDGLLYAIAPTFAGSGHSTTFIVDTNTGTLTEIDEDDGDIIIDDPFSDISAGPIM